MRKNKAGRSRGPDRQNARSRERTGSAATFPQLLHLSESCFFCTLLRSLHIVLPTSCSIGCCHGANLAKEWETQLLTAVRSVAVYCQMYRGAMLQQYAVKFGGNRTSLPKDIVCCSPACAKGGLGRSQMSQHP